MDHDFTERIRAWLDTPEAERDITAGATMLLQLDRNQILFNTIMRRPEAEADRLEYHLRKHLAIRDEGRTLAEVAALEEKVLPAVAATLEADAPQVEKTEEGDEVELSQVHAGRSPHHERFPEHIRALYDRSGTLFRQMQELYHRLLGMADAAPCDRHELLVQLAAADDAYRRCWADYDAFADAFDPTAPDEDDADAPSESEEPDEDDAPEAAAAAPDAKAVSAARKYLSDARRRLSSLSAASEERIRLLASMQERIDLVLTSGGGFKPDFRDALTAEGLSVGEVPA